MKYLDNIFFVCLLILGIGYFTMNVKKIIRNIKFGQKVERFDNPRRRWTNMAMVALGQSKMVRKPLVGILHIIVYISFFLINIELLEIIVDGIVGTHRVFSFMGGFYNFIIGFFEILAFGTLFSVVVFWIRRNIIKIKRFIHNDLEGWPKVDANNILYFEMLLMTFFLTMNASDVYLQSLGSDHYIEAGYFPITSFIVPIFNNLSEHTVIIIERTAWWLHIIGILVYLNYLYFSKHLHIVLAFPNTYFANLDPKGRFLNLESVTREVKLMMDPNSDPYAPIPTIEGDPQKFGASDVQDLNWVQLMNAYTCTECGRCTENCPANITGKKLSPRNIMMKTRDRIEEVGKNMDRNKGVFVEDSKTLLHDYITAEEIWACTTCNACVESCPISIDPLSIIIDLRRYLVMEKSAAPTELNGMMVNIENNGAPWPYSQMDRLNWMNES